MSNEFFGQEFDEAFINAIQEQAANYIPENDSDYEVNRENYSKVAIITALLNRFLEPEFDLIRPIEFVPRYRNVTVEADFEGLILKGDAVSNLKTILELSDMVDFCVMNGKLHMEFTVKNVFENKT